MLVNLFMEVFNMSDSKKNLISVLKIICFALVFVFVFLTLTYIMRPINANIKNIAGFYSEEDNTLDMVYIGGSAAFVYWEPLKAYEEYGIASYNYAFNSVQAETYIYSIKEVLKTQNPELIIIDARAFQYRDDQEKGPNSPFYYNFTTSLPFSWNRFNYIENTVPKYLQEDTLAYHFDIMKYHTRNDIFDFKTSIKMMLGIYRNEYKGFDFYPWVGSIERQDFQTDKETPISNETKEILDELLSFMKTVDTKFLFVVSPYSMSVNDKQNFNYIQKIIEETGYPFLDANEFYDEMNLDFDTNFYNVNHVNIFGAEKYTEFLADYLKENYDLPDRREDPTYESWDDLLGNWHKQVNVTKEEINKLIKEGS